jgi:hypothetical protein
VKTIYLHIGTFKTGTSSIQLFLNENREQMERAGFFVPYGDLRFQYVLPLSLIIDHTQFRAAWPAVKKSAAYYWEQLHQQIAETECKNILISAENFCDLVHPGAREKAAFFAEFLQRQFSEHKVVVIVYLRNLPEYIDSMYREIIKVSCMTSSLNEFIREGIENRDIHINPCIYLDYFSTIFGKKSLIVRKYQREELLNHNIVDDFLSVIGCAIDADTTVQTDYHTNVSLNRDCTQLKKVFNELKILDYNFNFNLSNMLVHAVTTTNEETSIDTDELKKFTDEVYDKFHVEIGENMDLLKQSKESLSDGSIFSTLLLGVIIQQNKTIISLLNKILKQQSQ